MAKIASESAGPPLFPGETYEYLEQRPHRWRKQLFLKGRNMAVVHLVYSMRTNNVSPEEAVNEFGLPLEQIQEALRYYELHRDLIEAEQQEERWRLKRAGITIDPPLAPR
jgi:uncharacterized protein (DUF433 family)